MLPSVSAKGVFFVGTDTGVGKTYQCAQFIRCLKASNIDVGVYKPVASGCAIEESSSDPWQLGQAAGLDPSQLARICPQNFLAPLAPPAAAAREGRTVDERVLVDGATWWLERCQFLVVEGAGGVMSPISSSMTVLDLATQLQLPIVLVTANRLGCISHVLVAVEAILSRKLELWGVVLNEVPNRDSDSEFTAVNRNLLQDFLPGIPIVDRSDSLAHRVIGKQSSDKGWTLPN